MTTPSVEIAEWDTTFWGVRAARITAIAPPDLDVVDARCRELGIRWGALLAPSHEFALINAAVRHGYDVVDVRCTLSARIDGHGVGGEPTLARPDDVDSLAAIARESLRHSRFFADPHLLDARCEDFYETWVRNSFTGQLADAIVVARTDGRPDGFITVRIDADGNASIPLVAVRPDRQGGGLGRRMLTDTIDWARARGAERISVVTQLANGPAMGLYESLGFALRESGVWLHRWFDGPEASER